MLPYLRATTPAKTVNRTSVRGDFADEKQKAPPRSLGGALLNN
jgi:hypothetical protein